MHQALDLTRVFLASPLASKNVVRLLQGLERLVLYLFLQ